MLILVIGALAVALWAGHTYLVRERLGLVGAGLAALRVLGVTSLLLLLLNPGRAVRVSSGYPVVLLDASLSMGMGGRWSTAVDTALALAGRLGTVMRFGSAVVPFDTLPPTDGASELRDALLAARASGGPVHVVTDGEIDDLVAIPEQMLDAVHLVVLPRDTVLDAALLDVAVPRRVQRDDSIPVDLTLGVWGLAGSHEVSIVVAVGDRELVSQEVELRSSPVLLRRRVTVPPGLLPVGANVLRVGVTLEGDDVAANDSRLRTLTVTDRPTVVVLVDAPDWESRFLANEIAGVVGAGVRSFTHVAEDRWLDTQTFQRIARSQVSRAVSRSALLVIRGDQRALDSFQATGRHYWYWPAGLESAPGYSSGDWYPSSQVPPSPLVGGIGLVEWDSLPPLVGLSAVDRPGEWWVGFVARLGRRGVERPVVIGRDSAGTRSMVTVGSGLWRWSFRGGAPREAYRALLAAGTNWLLGTRWDPSAAKLTTSYEVPRGEPVRFSWPTVPVPESVAVSFVHATTDSSTSTVLRFDAQRNAVHHLPPGVYRWSVDDEPQANGVTVVERYSSELAPRRVGVMSGGVASASALVESHVRERWLLFALAILALAGEWGWRYRRGLP